MRLVLILALFIISWTAVRADQPNNGAHPNIVFVLIDDLGYGDLSCYGNAQISTPNIDRLAAEGLRFGQFYVAAPICSASRVAAVTGQYPARHRISSALSSREENRRRGMVDFLDPSVPTIARTLQNAGYATAHFGKWHLGGGRDVDDAPLPREYGFEESLTSFEGLGDRVLIPGHDLSQRSAALGKGDIDWAPKSELSRIYVDRSIDFIRRHKTGPFYVQLWFDDVHDPFAPTTEQLKKWEHVSSNRFVQQYCAVLDALDREIGRLVDEIDKLGLGNDTLIVLASDNGPTAWPSYERAAVDAPGSTNGLRGRKWSLYEGGIRGPLIVRWPGAVPAGKVNESAVIGAVDLFATFCRLADVAPPEIEFDGVDMSRAFLGHQVERQRPLCWQYGDGSGRLGPARPIDRSPSLAIRDGRWKLLMNPDGGRLELYDLAASPREYANVAGKHPDVVDRLSGELLAWTKSLPSNSSSETSTPKGQSTTISYERGARGHLVTRWAGDVDPQNPLPEYPRPQMVRDRWQNLNGFWQYAIRGKDAEQPKEWDGRILVPFSAESLLSGVRRRVGSRKMLWYRRTFDVPDDWSGQRLLVHFGAVDWQATVWLNGTKLGSHQGGYDPFSIDITEALRDDREQEIVVAVWDPTNDGPQPRGKQTKAPSGIWYTPVTGIWQTVWLEPVPQASIKRLKIVPDADDGSVGITVETARANANHRVELRVTGVSRVDESAPAPQLQASGKPSEPITLKLGAEARMWSPSEPWLYEFEAVLVDTRNNRPQDHVKSYFGLREIKLGRDKHGIDRLFLNGRPLFHFGPLDQGWWPDGLYTAPTDEALRYDIEATKRLSFNMARKHVKVEPARWYYWADKLGLMVWQDMPHGMQGDGRGANHVMHNMPDLDLPDEARQTFRRELQAIIDALHNHPSIVVWVPFNEGWGQHDTNDLLQWTKQYDPTRLVDGPSGWMDRGYGDLKDLHRYPGPDMFAPASGRASVLGEFGGLGLPIEGHLWEARNNWGYRSYKTTLELQQAYEAVMKPLPDLIRRGLAAAVYTQTTDVEIEVNGILTYDRAIMKLDAGRLRELHRQIIETPIEEPDDDDAQIDLPSN